MQESSYSTTEGAAPYNKKPRMRCLTTRVLSWRNIRKRRPEELMDRGTNETPGSESKEVARNST
jgi:hypothetical protein